MKILKRLVLVGFILLWLAGFLLIAPSPLYRFLYLQANQQPLESPYQLFETIDWTHPHYYGDLAQAVRTLAQSSTTDTIYLYLDSESPIHSEAYRRYFEEYDFVWGYPHVIKRVGDLDAVPEGATVIISSTIPPKFDCTVGEENLYLCRF